MLQKFLITLKFKSLIIYCLFFMLYCYSTTINASYYPTVWDVLRQLLSLNHHVNQSDVQNQIRWVLAHPGYIQKVARQSEPYIYHIINEIKKRRLPGEIALIPMIESSYNPFAYSQVGAAGLWQLMPGTANDLGLKQDWWFDGRRSIQPSTDAALNYLAYLHSYFNGDWILAIAAYDAGEGAMSRAVKNSPLIGNKLNFWSLNVPQETRVYVPRLLALAEIFQNPQRYRIELPEIPHLPYFREVNIGSQIDLGHAAKLAGMSYQALIKLNPGFNRWATAPYTPYKLLIPVSKVESFSRNLANVPIEKRVSWIQHRVRPGDNLASIAREYHTTVNLIKGLNQLKANSVKKGQDILIPGTKNTVSPKLIPAPLLSQHFIPTTQYKVIHIIQNRETYQYLQQKYHVTAQQIQAWNHLNAHDVLEPGQQLIIWKPSLATTS